MKHILNPVRAVLHGTGLRFSAAVAALTRITAPQRAGAPQAPMLATVEGQCDEVVTAPKLEDPHSETLAEMKRAMREGRYEDVVAAVSGLNHLRGERNLRNRCLRQLRMLQVDALAMLGRGFAASEALDQVDSYYGRTWDSCIQRGNLAMFTGEYDRGLDAVESALLMPPLQANSKKMYERAALLKVDLLSQLGEYERAREFFLRVFPGGDPKIPLTYIQLSSLRRTIKDESSLATLKDMLIPSFGYRGRRALSALFHYSIAARDLGFYAEALLAIQRRFIVGTKILLPGGKKPVPKPDWSASARQALLDLRSDLSQAQIQFFLISGTLLGCIREGTILGHDKDIDVGVMDEHSAAEIRDALAGKGRFVVLPEISPRLLRVKHINGVMIDVFIHWREDGRIWHEGQKTRWWNAPFNLISTEFLGELFLVPEDADQYLTENYGGWREPVYDFETFCDTPNMVVAHQEELLWYFQRVLLDHYHSGKRTQFNKVWAEIKKIHRPGVEMRMAVEMAQRKLGVKRAIEGGGE